MTLAIAPDDVLVVVDMQYDFLPGGSLAVTGGDEIVPLINALAKAFRNVVLTQDWHPADHISFASQHAGKAPFETIELDYGTQVLWPDHCVWNSMAPRSAGTSTFPMPSSCCARVTTGPSTAIRASRKRIARR